MRQGQKEELVGPGLAAGCLVRDYRGWDSPAFLALASSPSRSTRTAVGSGRQKVRPWQPDATWALLLAALPKTPSLQARKRACGYRSLCWVSVSSRPSWNMLTLQVHSWSESLLPAVASSPAQVLGALLLTLLTAGPSESRGHTHWPSWSWQTPMQAAWVFPWYSLVPQRPASQPMECTLTADPHPLNHCL